MTLQPTPKDNNLMLSVGDFHSLMQVYKRVELKFNVKFLFPRARNAVRPTDLMIVGVSGQSENCSSAIEFCESFLFQTRPVSMVCPRKLDAVFSNSVWIKLLEDLHDVLIVREQESEIITVMGSKAPLVAFKLNNLIGSLGVRFGEAEVARFEEQMRKIQSPEVPLVLKKEAHKAASVLLDSCTMQLLTWIEEYVLKFVKDNKEQNGIKESEDQQLDDSVILLSDEIILLQPNKNTTKEQEIPLITLSDDEDSEPSCSTWNGNKGTFVQPDFVQPSTSSASVCYVPEPHTDQKSRKYHVMHQAPRKKKMKKTKREKWIGKAVCSQSSNVIQNSHGNIKDTGSTQEIRVPSIPAAPVVRRLRPIVIDGNNVAVSHGQPRGVFSCRGIQICIDYFLNRGHTEVTAFVPRWRQRHVLTDTTDQGLLDQLSKSQRVVFTPSRKLDGGKRISSYDDRFIVKLAVANGGVIVSNDNFRDIINEDPTYREVILNRLLMFCFVGDFFMVPDDPLGKEGPHIEKFLAFPDGEGD